jgi:hypothetical protein
VVSTQSTTRYRDHIFFFFFFFRLRIHFISKMQIRIQQVGLPEETSAKKKGGGDQHANVALQIKAA